EEAGKAERYNELNSLLKQIEIRLLITEISRLHEQWTTEKYKLEQAKLKEIELNTSIQSKEANLTENRHALQKIDEKTDKLQSDLLGRTEQLEKYLGEKNVLTERLKHYEENK